MDWKTRLTSEKSLLQVYWKARKVASARSNSCLAWIVFAILAIALGANACFGMPVVPYASLIVGVRQIADVGFAFTTAILGFLITGFAIFASITKPAVFILLAKLDHKEGGISRLQFIFFNFLLVFIHFLAFLSVCLLAKITLHSGGPLSSTLRWIAEVSRAAIVVGASIVFSVMTAWLLFLLMLLKSFIWNLYQAVLVTIGAEAELNEQQGDCDQ